MSRVRSLYFDFSFSSNYRIILVSETSSVEKTPLDFWVKGNVYVPRIQRKIHNGRVVYKGAAPEWVQFRKPNLEISTEKNFLSPFSLIIEYFTRSKPFTFTPNHWSPTLLSPEPCPDTERGNPKRVLLGPSVRYTGDRFLYFLSTLLPLL